MRWRRRPVLSDTSPNPLSGEQLHALLVTDPERGWRAFIDRYTPELLALIERAGIVDGDEAMEIYVWTCERLSENHSAALRRRDPSQGSLSGWLAVVVRRAIVDWVRSRVGRRRLFGAIRHLDRFHQRLFELTYWEGRRPAEAAEILRMESATEVSIGAVLDALETLDGALTARHRADLLSMAARSQAPLSFDADDNGITLDVAADVLDPEAALGVRETEAQLNRALASLPAEDAAIVSLKYGEGLSRPQIQRLLRLPDLTEHRVRSILSALRRSLVDGLGPVAAPGSAAGGAAAVHRSQDV